ncbi:MAG TPA: hypothetical protein VFA10_13305 [Ktedonobacteraceae bacterium]|nr:hypothetical protein [Ktedonobacteraceae bacterium]
MANAPAIGATQHPLTLIQLSGYVTKPEPMQGELGVIGQDSCHGKWWVPEKLYSQQHPFAHRGVDSHERVVSGTGLLSRLPLTNERREFLVPDCKEAGEVQPRLRV